MSTPELDLTAAIRDCSTALSRHAYKFGTMPLLAAGDDGGLHCSCGQWQQGVVSDVGYRPWVAFWTHQSQAAIEAAFPYLLAQIREGIAVELEAAHTNRTETWDGGFESISQAYAAEISRNFGDTK